MCPGICASERLAEWLDAKSRENFHATECSRQFSEGLTKHGLSRLFSIPLLGDSTRRVISPSATDDSPVGELYEICSAYFPTTLSVAVTKAIEWIDAPFENLDDRPLNRALVRALGWAWAEGEVQYQGKAARRMIYIFRREDKQARRDTMTR